MSSRIAGCLSMGFLSVAQIQRTAVICSRSHWQAIKKIISVLVLRVKLGSTTYSRSMAYISKTYEQNVETRLRKPTDWTRRSIANLVSLSAAGILPALRRDCASIDLATLSTVHRGSLSPGELHACSSDWQVSCLASSLWMNKYSKLKISRASRKRPCCCTASRSWVRFNLSFPPETIGIWQKLPWSKLSVTAFASRMRL